MTQNTQKTRLGKDTINTTSLENKGIIEGLAFTKALLYEHAKKSLIEMIIQNNVKMAEQFTEKRITNAQEISFISGSIEQAVSQALKENPVESLEIPQNMIHFTGESALERKMLSSIRNGSNGQTAIEINSDASTPTIDWVVLSKSYPEEFKPFYDPNHNEDTQTVLRKFLESKEHKNRLKTLKSELLDQYYIKIRPQFESAPLTHTETKELLLGE